MLRLHQEEVLGMKVARDEIVVAARELFREKGYAGASMQDLADSVGLKKASLYMRFPNKEALVPAVLEMLLEDTLFQAEPKTAAVSGLVAYEALVGAIAANLSERKRCVGLHLAYGVNDDMPAAKGAVRDFFQSLHGRMSNILMEVMSEEDAKTVAADALARLEGATLFAAVFEDDSSMQRAVRACLADAKAAAEVSS
jgi:TetR/AcrR family transcriptional regulator, transcriptional repressor for nem operon